MVGLPPPPTSAGGGGLRTNPNRQPPTVPSQSYQGPQRHFLCLPIHACPPTLEHSHAPQTPNPLRDSSIFLEFTTSATSLSLKNSQRFSLIRGKTNGAESPCNKPPPPPLRAHHVACVPFRRGEAGLRRSPTRRALPSPPPVYTPYGVRSRRPHDAAAPHLRPHLRRPPGRRRCGRRLGALAVGPDPRSGAWRSVKDPREKARFPTKNNVTLFFDKRFFCGYENKPIPHIILHAQASREMYNAVTSHKRAARARRRGSITL